MRTDAHTSRLARWVTVTAILTLMGGCKKDEPAPAAASSPDVTLPSAEKPQAPMPPVPLAETFVLSDVTFRYEEGDGENPNSYVYVSYRVNSRSTKRERVYLCADLIDKDGLFLDEEWLIDWFSLWPGDTEEVIDELGIISPGVWDASEVLRFQLREGGCQKSASVPRSNMVILAKSGLPPPPGAKVEGRTPEVEANSRSAPWLRLEDVRIRQNDEWEVWVDYRLTNLTKGRAPSRLCVRLVNDMSCTCRGIDQAESEDFNLGLEASERRSSRLRLKDEENWSRGRYLVLYTSKHGCYKTPEEATSNVLVLAKPQSIQAPEPLGEETGEVEDSWEP